MLDGALELSSYRRYIINIGFRILDFSFLQFLSLLSKFGTNAHVSTVSKDTWILELNL